MEPIYSICMCNYNMAGTLERAVSTVATQLDDRFEIVLVDDGSSDESVSVMHELAERYPIIRVFDLTRDSKRKLGETRNISIQRARGRYCLLHLDCDDVWDEHIPAWVQVFHQIESAIGSDVLLGGQQIHMAKRDLLLRHGPYPNIFRGEDRAMYLRFAATGILWFLRHEIFRTRLTYSRTKRWRRTVMHTLDHMTNDFRDGSRLWEYIRFEIMKAKERTWALVLFRFMVIPMTWIRARLSGPIPQEGPPDGYNTFGEYRGAHTGTFPELMRRHGGVPNWRCIPQASRRVFDI